MVDLALQFILLHVVVALLIINLLLTCFLSFADLLLAVLLCFTDLYIAILLDFVELLLMICLFIAHLLFELRDLTELVLEHSLFRLQKLAKVLSFYFHVVGVFLEGFLSSFAGIPTLFQFELALFQALSIAFIFSDQVIAFSFFLDKEV